METPIFTIGMLLLASILADACPAGRWGVACAQRCRHCTLPDCDIATGVCPPANPTCRMGYAGPRCEDSCEVGYYGAACASECGHCRGGRGCDPVTGECPVVPFSLCLAGWRGSNCNMECEPGTYGLDCAIQCKCSDPGECDRITGACGPAVRVETRAQSQNQSARQDRACPEGRWGTDCYQVCGHCTQPRCDTATGNCPLAYPTCQAGYTGPSCSTPCMTGYYGAACAWKCGHCRGGRKCDTVSGECPLSPDSLCLAGWKGSKCDMECDPGTHGPDCANSCQCKGSVNCDRVTGACGATAYTTRQPQTPPPRTTSPQDASPRDANHGSGTGPECAKGTWGSECAQTCSDHCARGRLKCDAQDGTCLGGCADGFQGDRCDAEASDLGLVVGLALGGVFLLIVIASVLAALYCRRRRRRQPAPQPKTDYLTPVNPPNGPVFIPGINPPDLLELNQGGGPQYRAPSRPPVAAPGRPVNNRAPKPPATAPPIYERAAPESPEHIYCSANQSRQQEESDTLRLVSQKPPASYISLI